MLRGCVDLQPCGLEYFADSDDSTRAVQSLQRLVRNAYARGAYPDCRTSATHRHRSISVLTTFDSQAIASAADSLRPVFAVPLHSSKARRREFFNDRQFQALKQDGADLFSRIQIERPARELVRFCVKLREPLAEFAALLGELFTIHEYAIALEDAQDSGNGHFDLAVNALKPLFFSQTRIEYAVQLQGEIGVFRRVFGCLVNRRGVKANLRGAFAAHIRVLKRLYIEQALRETVQIVMTVRFQHI